MERNPAAGDLSSLRIPHQARSSRKRRWPAAFLAVLILALAAAGYAFRERIFPLGPVVATGMVTRSGGAVEDALLTANGYVVARIQAGVTPKISGRIKALHKDLGDRVTKGEVLAELESADVLAMLEEARATAWVAELTAERERKLAEAQVGARSDRDLAEARAKEAGARVKNLEEQVENTKVRAPFDGIIVVKNGEVGETVSLFGAQTSRKTGPIFVVADFREFEVEADVNESNIAKVEAGQPAEVALDAVPDRRYQGRLRQVVPTADRQKATVQVKVTILDHDEKVYPEMSAKVLFLKSSRGTAEPPRVLAPAEGIVERDGRKVAYVVDGDRRVRRVTVETGPQEAGGRVQVRTGLTGGESIVLSPPGGLADGERVRVE